MIENAQPDVNPENIQNTHSSNEKVVWLIFWIVVLCIILFFSIQYYKQTERFQDYDGPRGTFVVETLDLGYTTQYRVHVYDEGGNKYLIPLRHPPWDVDDEIPLPSHVLSALNKPEGIRVLYVTQDPYLSNETEALSMVAAGEFVRILGKQGYGVYQLTVENAFTRDTDSSVPVITCDSITDEDSVILLRIGSVNRVTVEGACVVIEGVDGQGLVKAADAFSYYLLGVIA